MMQHTIVISFGGRTRQLALSVCRRLRGRKASYLLLSMLLCFTSAQANPTNPHVVAGGATFAATNNLLEVSNLPGTIINWQDFSIASDEITRFIQQSASSAVLNRVTGRGISEVLGTLQSNGQVFVINPNGLLIGENAFINTAGFVGSTLDIDDQAFLNQDYQFSGQGGMVENMGLIQVTGSGDVVLLGTSVANSGIVRTEDGNIVLAAGRSIALNFADMDHIVFKLQAADDAVLNLGEILARGGNVALAGGDVQQQGNIELVRSPDGRIFLQADGEARVSGSMSAPGGHISVLAEHISLQQADISTSSANDGGEILIGGDYQGGNGVRTATTTQIDEQSSVSANATSNGDGGRIIVWSDEHTQVAGRLSASAGDQGGDGGFIETSSIGQLDVSATVSVSAANGAAGEWLLDPEDIVIDDGMATSIEGTLNEGGNVTVKTADQGDGEGNITVASSITKTAGDDASLTLDAHNDIEVNAPISSESNKLDVTLRAGKSVDVNAEITTNGGNFAAIISAASDATDTVASTDSADDVSVDPEDSTDSGDSAGQDLLADTDSDAAADDDEVNSEAISDQNSTDVIAESDTGDAGEAGSEAGAAYTEVAAAEETAADAGEGVANAADDIEADGADGGSQLVAETNVDPADNDADSADIDRVDAGDVDTVVDAGDAASADVGDLASDSAETQGGEQPEANAESAPEAPDTSEVNAADVALNVDAVDPEATAADVDVDSIDESAASDVAVEEVEAGEAEEETTTIENISEELQVSIATAIDTAGGDIDINAGSQADVVVSSALDASNLADNTTGGNVSITTGTFLSTADIITNGTEQGGSISIDAEHSTALGGDLVADGRSGGQIEIDTGHLSLAESISAQGSEGKGGSVNISVDDQTLENSSSSIDVSGSSGGSIRHVAGRQITSSGAYRAIGTDGEGGTIDISAGGTKLLSATIDASGETAGGSVRVGGEFQGGKDLTEDELPNAVLLAVNDGVEIRADGLGEGSDGGNVILWADDTAAVYGTVSAAQNRLGADVGDGGFVEISSGNVLTYGGDATAGLGGTVLFDPKNIVVDETPLSSQYALILGFNYNPIIGTLENSDLFGNSISLSSDGTRLAVGAVGDDGFGIFTSSAGAVHLFSFTDGNFSGGVLESTIGKGYVGGKNFNVTNLGANDNFGQSVSLDGDGDRLAVGALRDDGFNNVHGSNGSSFSGAAYLFSFTDTSFSNPGLQAIFGSGYQGESAAGGDPNKNRTFGTGNQSQFASGVALNNAGDRLAIGSPGDFRFGAANFYEGAVYLFTFTDDQFSGGTQVGKIADFNPSGFGPQPPAPGPNDLNLTFLDDNDYLGTKLDLNAAGDRLVVTAPGDAGFGNSGGFLTGAVHMFSFSDTNFSDPTFEGTIGRGYNNIVSGPNDFDPGDIAPAGNEFGSGISINDVGDRIAISGDRDDGFGDPIGFADTGVIHVIDFTDNSFSGASEERRIGFGYTGGNNVDVADLEAGDRTSGVALNGAGDRLAGGWFVEDGAANGAINSGAVRFFDLNLPGGSAGEVADAVFLTAPDSSITISPGSITDITNTGSAVALQANNDISVLSAILSNNPVGDGGDLSFQAGRSILIDAAIDTDNGNFTAIANETIANGAVDANRDAGAAEILINADVTTGTGDIVFEVRDDPTKVDNTRGVISVQALVMGNNVSIVQGNDVSLGDVGNVSPSTINAAGNLNINIDGLFSVQGGAAIGSDATIFTDGSATVSAAEIEFTGLAGIRSMQADSIDLTSSSTTLLDGAQLNANLDISSTSLGDTILTEGTTGIAQILSTSGMVEVNSGASINLNDEAQIVALAGNVTIDAMLDFNLGDEINNGLSQVFSGTDLNINAGGSVLLQGGGASDAGALLNAAGNTTINAVGDLAVNGGAAATSEALILVGGDADFDAGSISFTGDVGASSLDANSIDLNSDSSIVVVDAQLIATQNILFNSGSGIEVNGGGPGGLAFIGSIAGTVDLSSGGSISIVGDSQIDAAADSITLNAGQDFALGDAASAGTSSITAGGPLDVNAGGAIHLSGGTAGAQAGSAIIEITGDASLMAVGDISLLAGSVADADVGVAAENISLDSGANILLQGGTATGADVLVDANGTANLNATGDLTVQGGSAVGANAIVLSNSLSTINIGAASVSLLTDTGQALLNVLDGAAGSTVNITTPGACVNCVQVALADPEGIVADVINIFGQPEEPAPPTVEPPEMVAESPDPVVEDPVVTAPPQPAPEPEPEPEPEDEITPEPEEMTPPDDIINEVLVLNSNDDETDLGQQSAATESTGEDDEGEAEEEPTQCRA